MTRYLLFVVIGTALFWGLYRLLLHKEHCLRLNRFFLLTTLALSLLIPLVHPTVPVTSYSVSGNGYLISLPIQGEEMPLTSPTQREAATGLPNTNSIGPWQIIALLYWAGVALSLLLLAVRYIATWRKLHLFSFSAQSYNSGSSQRHYYVAVDDNIDSSFSFFNHVAINRQGLTYEESNQVLAHELAHARQRHSWDTLFVQLVRCLLWFNPFAWLYVRELSTIHEYLADEAVLRQGNEETYSHYLQLLFKQATGMKYSPIVNNFHFSTIKNRITMMNQPKSHRGWVKALSALPVAALLLFANCKNQEPAQQQAAIPDGQYLVSPFIDTYRDGQLVEREFMGVLLPLEELDKHKVFADSAEAARYTDRLVVEGKAVRTVSMVNLNDSAAARWYDVAWADDRDALSWWDEEDSGKFKLAEYPGGMEAMANYVSNSVVYPEKAKADNVQGKVYVQFVVDTDGSIVEATVLHGVGGECDDEALRVVKSMPKWQPATFKGKPVRSKYVMPIYYTLK